MLQNNAMGDATASFDIIANACAQPMLLLDPYADRIVDANPAACRLLGYDRALLKTVKFSALHPGQLPALIVFTEAVLAKGSFWTRGLTARDAAGNELSLEYVGSALRPSGRPLVHLAISDLKERERRDADAEADLYIRGGIAEWQRVERVFRDLERENQLLLRAAGDGIFGVNTEGKTTFINPAGERMLGWKAEELIGRDMHTIVHHRHPDGSHYPREDCPIYAAFHDGAVHKVDNEVLWRKDGTCFWVEYTSTPVRDRGRLVGAVMIFRDITARREADEKLRAALAEVGQLRHRLELENAYLQEEIRFEGNRHGIVGRSAAIEHARRQVELVGPTDATVLITGESGTGKELIARAIHEASARSRRPLIRVNCAAVPSDLFESEFFGHRKGSFTGAVSDKQGLIQSAEGGTLFLDEIADLPLHMQVKLLRVIQEKAVRPVGESREQAVDVRILSATHKNLAALVAEGKFREDLFYRINVIEIRVPALRERLEDIPELVDAMLTKLAKQTGVPELHMTDQAMAALSSYSFPGNVRELENVLERAATLCSNGVIDVADLQLRPKVVTPELPIQGVVPPGEKLGDALEDIERDAILRALEQTRYNKTKAAQLLGMTFRSLRYRIKKLGIE